MLFGDSPIEFNEMDLFFPGFIKKLVDVVWR